MNFAAVGPIAVHLPERVETNAQLKAEFPSWDMDLIYEKTGIGARRATLRAGETALDACGERVADAATGARVSPHQFLNIHG